MKLIKNEKGLQIYTDIELDCSYKFSESDKSIKEYAFDLKWNLDEVKKSKSASVELRFIVPDINSQYIWTPMCGTKRFVDAEWRTKNPVMMTNSAPVACIFNEEEENILTIACSETKKVTRLEIGVDERSSYLFGKIKLELKQYTNADSLTVKVLVNERKEMYFESIDRVRVWWEEKSSMTPAEVPDFAKDAMYSSWYSFHQDFTDKSIESECEEAKKCGFKSIIVDDGWQTDVVGEGYSTCGDWEVAQSKIPDMAEHVKRVHDIGLKYILWFSIPFVGYKSKNWDKFKNKVLYKIDRLSAGILDPRYPDVREFLIKTYENALKKYDLDGFKLDFIDRFLIVDEENNKITDEMDYVCVQEAADALMTEVMKRLRKIKSDVLIEFRQAYIGPNMRKYANMFRVSDCPNDYVSNRIGICDLRLLSGNTAVHSDMLMWNSDEKTEIAARQILNVIFGTIQVSVKLENLSEEHKKMLDFWIDFALKNKETLLNSQFYAKEPQNLYPVITAFDKSTEITGIYAKNKVVNVSDKKNIKIINASNSDEVYLKFEKERSADITVKNCMGELAEKRSVKFQKGVNTVKIPQSGIMEF